MTLTQLQKLFADDARRAGAIEGAAQDAPERIRPPRGRLNGLGYALLKRGEAADAVAILELVAAAYPDSANAHDSLGDAYEAAGRTAEAITKRARARAGGQGLGTAARSDKASAEEKCGG